MAGWLMFNEASGVVVPARCARNVCAYCLPLNARRRAQAVAWAGARRAITLTEVAARDDPEPWQTARRRINRTREYLVRLSIDPGLWGSFVERGEDTGMIHAHIAQKGPRPVPKEALQEAAHRAGGGWSRIEAIRGTGDFSRYVGKSFSRYVGKSFSGEDTGEALRLNGGRIGHFSRGYFLSQEGRTIGVREAEKEAAKANSGESRPGRWVLIEEHRLGGSVARNGGPA